MDDPPAPAKSVSCGPSNLLLQVAKAKQLAVQIDLIQLTKIDVTRPYSNASSHLYQLPAQFAH